jgi:hypothetical protein
MAASFPILARAASCHFFEFGSPAVRLLYGKATI